MSKPNNQSNNKGPSSNGSKGNIKNNGGRSKPPTFRKPPEPKK